MTENRPAFHTFMEQLNRMSSLLVADAFDIVRNDIDWAATIIVDDVGMEVRLVGFIPNKSVATRTYTHRQTWQELWNRII